MFGLGLTQILFTVAVATLVWLIFRWNKRLRTLRAQDAARRQRLGEGGGRKAAAQDAAESFVACRVCGTYVDRRGATSCGRADCPYAADRHH